MSPKRIAKALIHLKKHPHMRRVLRKHTGKPGYRRSSDAFVSLAKSIVYQQLSGKAAGTIWGRFVALYPKGIPTPKAVIKTPLPKLRKVGLSGQKASYIKDLAKKFINGTINSKLFATMTDEEIREHVITVKGIGRWTADMFLMFTLNRPDVLPTGDLGIQKGFKKLFNLRSLPSPTHMERLALPWAPYRTVASWYLWRLVDNE